MEYRGKYPTKRPPLQQGQRRHTPHIAPLSSLVSLALRLGVFPSWGLSPIPRHLTRATSAWSATRGKGSTPKGVDWEWKLAEGGIRTLTPFRAAGFKPAASTIPPPRQGRGIILHGKGWLNSRFSIGKNGYSLPRLSAYGARLPDRKVVLESPM